VAALLLPPGPALARAAAPAPAATDAEAAFAEVDRIFADYALDSHIPGVAYGIVMDGQLVHVGTLGVQDLATRRPVDADTLFRIASMTKAFTALTVLKLRDAGKLRLDAPAETYVPELRDWTYPTADSPRIRVRDLLTHSAGFVTDDPWGDRQTPLPEAEFSRLLREGVPFSTPPGTRMEYSNLGYALLGRVVTNVSGRPFAQEITASLLQPLGMDASGFFIGLAPREHRALGYRWEDGAWRPEPDMAHGAFAAMGGVQTSASDYAKWVAYLLSAWPPRDDADTGPVARATVRELAQGSNFPRTRERPGHTGPGACKLAITYGMGFYSGYDCDLGATLFHGGGYPGYGSHVLLLPEHGVGLFALTNRTYGGPSGAVWDAAIALKKAGLLADEPAAVGADLAAAYRAVAAIYAQGDVAAAGDTLAMNFLLDRDAAGWHRDLAELKAQAGDCDATAPIRATGALSGDFAWTCAIGRITGSVLLAPTRPPRIQSLKLVRAGP
jgi:CubicO group peptidase (beta-lactamase class C family)